MEYLPKEMMPFSIMIKQHKFQVPQETFNPMALTCEEVNSVVCSLQGTGT